MEILRNLNLKKPVRRARSLHQAKPLHQREQHRVSAMRRFAPALISSPNTASVCRYQATPIPIGSKRGGNYWPRSAEAERTDALLRDTCFSVPVCYMPFH